MVKNNLLKTYHNFLFFYRNLGFRIVLSITASLVIGIMDAFGLTMFLPLLEVANDSSTSNIDTLWYIKFIYKFIGSFGFSININSILLFMCIFFLIKGAANFASKSYRIVLRHYFIRKMRMEILLGLNRFSFKEFLFSDVGRIQNTITGEAERVGAAFRAYFWTIEQMILVIIYMCFAYSINAQFAMLVTIGGIMTNLIYRRIYKQTKLISREVTSDSHDLQGLIIQYVTNYKYLKVTGLIKRFGSKIKNMIFSLERNKRKILINDAILQSSREPLLIIVVACVILIQSKYFGLSLGPILISLLFFYRSLNSLMIMQTSYNQFLSVSGSMENMVNFQEELNWNKEKNGEAIIEIFNNSIELKNVSFNYKSENILKKINLTVNKNETIALIGESGSGKTTLLSIMAGLMPVDGGSICIDGKNIQEIDIKYFQKKIGYIAQDSVIFNDSIFNNVTFWAEPSEENILKFKEVTIKASISSFIDELPAGYETELGHNGINLSGGQKQRIAIARELYKKIDILFMDEATSSLDTETEKVIQNNIDKLKGQYTILIVAHRLSTVRKADRIILMDKGEILQIGNYSSLIKDQPKFRRMIELQEL